MKVVHVSHSDVNGGAARAAYRLHRALLNIGLNSNMLVSIASSDDYTVHGPLSKRDKLLSLLRPSLVSPLRSSLKTTNSVLHSPAVLGGNLLDRLRCFDPEIVHLHWINGEMISVPEIGRIQQPVVWTLHDMWPFCGAEHYSNDRRWQKGYLQSNRPSYERGFDLNRWVWKRKMKHWRRPMQIVAPSQWMADCVRDSAMMSEWPVSVIPNGIDTDSWAPVDKKIARELLGLPHDVPLMLFGAIGGANDPRKGFDLLVGALDHMRGNVKGLQLVVYGQSAPKDMPNFGFPVHYLGHLNDDLSLRVAYSAADLFVLPSRLDNLPNTGVEAHACGTPVVAFNIGGVADIVCHRETGYLAEPHSEVDLAAGILWVLSSGKALDLSENARLRAVSKFSENAVAGRYRHLYLEVKKY